MPIRWPDSHVPPINQRVLPDALSFTRMMQKGHSKMQKETQKETQKKNTPWPHDERMERIGQNGNEGLHYGSSLKKSQARTLAEQTGICTDGWRCGERPIMGFCEDGYCAQCPHDPDTDDPGGPFADPHSAAWFLEQALLHMEDRAATYDSPNGERSMQACVNAFVAITGDGQIDTAERGWMFMVLLKLVRSQQGAFKSDNYEDAGAYCSLMGESAAAERA